MRRVLMHAEMRALCSMLLLRLQVVKLKKVFGVN
jgi:hypothetical protein